MGGSVSRPLAMLNGTGRISSSGAIGLLGHTRDNLELLELSANSVFCLIPVWQFGIDLQLVNQINEWALEPLRAKDQNRSAVVASSDGSLPLHGNDRSAGSIVTLHCIWPREFPPKLFFARPHDG